MSNKSDNLRYHSEPVPGKISLNTTKSCETQSELSKAYSPGVADPCLEIKKDKLNSWKYTSKGNFVAVVSDGTAVLGLGNIGPDAAVPVMEGKAVLFKKFADIDGFPICLQDVFDSNGNTDCEKFIEVTKKLGPVFGGINLEDIAAPACFTVEKTLKEKMDIPVFHDDQHGTAIISIAAIKNALKLVDKKIEDCKFVINGAGAAGISCAELYLKAGAKIENFILCDIDGVIDKERKGLNPERQKFADAVNTNAKTLYDALKGADILLGVSVGKCISKDMIKQMAKDPIVFAMANPVPEIYPDEAIEAGAKVAGTGRSDFPNQVNNVLGFPGIFRGALDTRATNINIEMFLGASKALEELSTEKVTGPVLELLANAYPEDYKNNIFSGENPLKPEYVIPKPFDPRVVPRVAKYVAEAAMKSGVAQTAIDDLDEYEKSVYDRING
ncbi:MAG: NAD-dependent malic enzyme [Victivallales bacterium]|nr:NAD-dependent malic enzyme [Victivallales bacterium]MCF7888703.1 NAD-dependent malic enzyme [Victivallales bacterium]